MNISCKVKDAPERIGNKDVSWRDAQNSLERGNKKDFLSGLRMNGDGNMRNQFLVGGWKY